MSKFKVQPPIVHIPSFKKFGIYRDEILFYFTSEAHIRVPLNPLDGAYWYTDFEGWGKLLNDLVFKSNLYKKDIFDCDDYALKAMLTCRERYGLNGMLGVTGNTPNGYHMWNVVIVKIESGYLYKLMCFEPNEGFPFSGSLFELGDFGYDGEFALI